jgi:hypothetical protein
MSASRRQHRGQSRGRVARDTPFKGEWGAFFTSLGMIVDSSHQSDLGITYGATPRATGTAPPVITLSGTLNTNLPYAGFEVTATSAGDPWNGLVRCLRDNTTQTFTSAASVPMSGSLAGLVMGIAAGAASTDNKWASLIGGVADQSGNNKNCSQATAASQLILSAGVNNKPGMLISSSSFQAMPSTLSMPSPQTTPWWIFTVARIISSPGFYFLLTSNGNDVSCGQNNVANNLTPLLTNGPGGPLIAVFSIPLNTWFRGSYYNAGPNSNMRIGGIEATGNAGTNPTFAARSIGGTIFGGNMSTEIMCVTHMRGSAINPSTNEQVNNAVRQFYGPSVLI